MTTGDLLEVGVAGPHLFRGLAAAVSKSNRDQVKEEELHRLEEATHWQQTGLEARSNVIGHRLSGEVDHDVCQACGFPFGLRRHDHRRCARVSSDAEQCETQREPSRSGRDNKEIVRADRWCRHVADDVSVQAEMHQPHAERSNHQPFATGAEARDPLRGHDPVAHPLDGTCGEGSEDRPHLVNRLPSYGLLITQSGIAH